MRNLIYVIQFLLVGFCLQSCEDLLVNPAPREKKIEETYNSYGFVSASKKEMLINEEFSNNTRMWPMTFTTVQSHMFVGGGLLNMMTSYGGPIISSIELSSFTGSTNFEIEFLMQIEVSGYSGGNRLLWGYDAASKQYNFMEINDNDRQFSMGRFDGRADIKKTFYTTNWTGYYQKRSYNKFTIRKVNNTYYYFINDTFIYQEPFSAFKGNRIGFQTGISNELNIDWLTVKKLNL